MKKSLVFILEKNEHYDYMLYNEENLEENN